LTISPNHTSHTSHTTSPSRGVDGRCGVVLGKRAIKFHAISHGQKKEVDFHHIQYIPPPPRKEKGTLLTLTLWIRCSLHIHHGAPELRIITVNQQPHPHPSLMDDAPLLWPLQREERMRLILSCTVPRHLAEIQHCPLSSPHSVTTKAILSS
jgi:hypothetical protein